MRESTKLPVALEDRAPLLETDALRLAPGRALLAMAFLVSLAAIGVSVALGERGNPDAGWPIAMLGTALAGGYFHAIWVLGRQSVHLDRDGFTVRTLFHTKRYSWNVVSEFGLSAALPWRTMRHRYAVFDCLGDEGFAAHIRRIFAGAGHALPVGLEPADKPGNAATVTMIMNAWRDRALDAEAKAES